MQIVMQVYWSIMKLACVLMSHDVRLLLAVILEPRGMLMLVLISMMDKRMVLFEMIG